MLVTCNWFLCDFRVHLLNFVNLNSLLLVLSGLDDDKEWFSLRDSLILIVLGRYIFVCFCFVIVKLLSIIILSFWVCVILFFLGIL